jgi:DNA-binding transcriptional LysR family regulator
MAVRIARLPNSSLVSRPLTSTRMVLCASPAYLHAHGQPTHPSELAGHEVLAYRLFSMGDQWRFTGSEGRPRLGPR